MERSLAEVVKALAGGTMSRRQALAWMGATLAGAVLGRPGAASAAPARGEMAPGLAAQPQHGALLRGIDVAKKGRSLEGKFGFMFKNLPSFEPSDELLSMLATSMEEPRATPPSVTDNPRVPAGFVLLGQFIDHDLTFDSTPLAAQHKDPHALKNFRAARFDLDSVYGAGPDENPEFYDPGDRAKLRVARLGPAWDDLPRENDGKAIIGDPRDDSNLITGQLHLTFRKFHNALVDHVRAQGLRGLAEVFNEAHRLCRWHYQWMVVHDFLPRMVGQEVIDAILPETESRAPAEVMLDFYQPKNPNKPMMPVEFAGAAYRFGHSMLRPTYVVNENEIEAVLFGDSPTDSNLNGKRPIPRRLVIAWRHFFDIPGVPGTPTNAARRLDTDLSIPLFRLPTSVVPPPDTRVSLAERNLIRGKMLELPSGQRVAQEMDAEILSNERLGLGSEPGWKGQAPLWFYILKEAELHQNGERLGPVGGRIVAEVFLGLLKLDGDSYLNATPMFEPKPPIARAAGVFEIGDLLKFAGVA